MNNVSDLNFRRISSFIDGELEQSEVKILLREMEKTPNSDQCNHGRPTYLKLDLEKMNKLFGRT